MKKHLMCLLLMALSISFLPKGEIHAEAEETENIHYLGFTSDLHAVPDVLENALKQLPHTPEYFSLVGDMAGGLGNMRPEYRSSEVVSTVTSVFPNLSGENGNVSLIWADHDMNAIDDADVFKCVGDPKGYLSEQIYEGKNADGSTAYYIYGIGFNHMKSGGPESRDAAQAFKDWVKDKDITIPVIILCHMPMTAKRGDNLGAPYWNEALNYASTGVEGINSEEAEDAGIIRNVIFISGHNHTVDQNEYIYEPGSKMSIQIDRNLVSGVTGQIIETEAYDEEIAEESGEYTEEGDEDDPVLEERPPKPNTKAQGVISPIYYTSLVAGYLKTSGNVTLLEISDTKVTLNKFNGEGETALGSNDDGEVAGPLEIERIRWNEPEYTWSDDYTEVTAVRSLVNNPSYTEEETVETTSEITKEPTCVSEEERTYTAVFENEAFSSQTKVQFVEKTDHTPGSPKTENNVPPSCNKDGSYEKVIYCDVCGGELSRKTIPVGALGHAWGEWKITKEPTATQEGSRTRTCERDPSHTETEAIPATGKAAVYRFAEGSGGTWTKGSSSALRFTVKRDQNDGQTYSLFIRIEVDGKEIASSGYDISEGSLKIALKAPYLQGLSAGKHTIRAVFEDGSTETTFHVRSKNKSPNTSDDTGLLLWTMILIGSAAAAACTAYLRKHFAA